MPGKHSAKEKRMAKHIMKGYAKRGASNDRAERIAWATVNDRRKQKNESSAWMVSGSTNVFLGNPAPVSQFDPSSSTSPGMSYIPDEVAKQLVKESGLRKADTVSKRVIEGYLESMGLSRGLAVDVAKVLRDVYGITPTFDESLFAVSGSLIQELTGVLNESYPMPFAFDDEPRLLNEVDIVGSFLQREVMESTDEGYDLVLANMAVMPIGELCDVVEFYEWVGPEMFDYIENLAVNGRKGLAEKFVDGLCWPGLVKFMPEDVQSLLDEDAASDVIKNFKKKRQMAKPVSFRKQMKLAAKDRGGSDPLAAKAKAQADSSLPGKKYPAMHADPGVADKLAKLRANKEKEAKDDADTRGEFKKRLDNLARKKENEKADANARGFKAQRDAEKASAEKPAESPKPAEAPSPSRMKKAGSTAIGLMKKVGKGVAKLAGRSVTGTLGAIGHGVGALAGGVVRGVTGQKAAPKKSDSDDKPGVGGRIGHAIGRFAGHVKQGFKNATPGIQSQIKKGDDEAEPKKKQRVEPQVGESTMLSGRLIEEVQATFENRDLPDDPEPTIRTPAEVVSEFKADTVVDMAVIEAVAEMEWDEVAKTAGFMMLVPDRFLSLIQAFKEGTDVFRAEWNELEESGKKPEWMNVGSFVTLSKLSLDEGVVPRIVYWAGMALQAADDAIVSYVAESYPELGQTVYGPAGDPKEGPEIAKAYLTPQPAGTMTPTKSDCTTRMFSDPADREKARKAKLDDVMAAINGMKAAAAERGVAPEGMFLNLYRDMHRERVRYS